MWMHLAGLKIILPSTPADAKGLLKSAIRDNNPVVSFERSRLATATGPVPDGDHLVPIGVAEVKRAGTDVTIVGLAYYVGEALAVADELANEGISVEVVDPRTRCPWSRDAARLGGQDRPRDHRGRSARDVFGRVGDRRAHRGGSRDVSRPEGPPSAVSVPSPCPSPTVPPLEAGRPAEPRRHQGGRLRGAQGRAADPPASPGPEGAGPR